MTTRTSPARRCAGLALTAVLSAGLTTGCGNDAPADVAPELSAQLARVDRAAASGDEAKIRQRVEALVDATEAARDAGQLDDEQADRILAAADALLAQLPAEPPTPKPPPPPPSTATPSPDEDEGEDEDEHGHDEKGGPKHDEGKAKGHDKEED